MRLGAATFQNNGVFDVQADNNFLNNLGGTGQFVNGGTLKKTASTGTTSFTLPVDNDGSLLANTGTFELANGSGSGHVSSGSFNAPATLSFTGGTHDLSAASSITGTGIVRFQAGTSNVLGTYNTTKTEMVGGTANFEAPATTTQLAQSSGILAGAGMFTINGPSPASTWTAGNMNGTGTTRLMPGATMNLSGTSKDMSGGRLTVNDGTWNFNGTGDMRLGAATFQNNGVFDIQIDSNYLNNLGGTGQFNNAVGAVLKKTGIGTSAFTLAVDNDGSLQANSGTFELAAGSGSGHVSSGSFSVPATLAFTGGTHDLAAASSVAGAGIVRFQGGTVNVLGSYNPTKTEIIGGTANFEAPASTTQLALSGGTLAGAGTLTVNGPSPASTWTGGSMNGVGTLRIGPTATMNLSGSSPKDFNSGRVTDNQGTWNLAGTGDMRSAASTFQNNGAFDIQTDNALPEQPRRNRPVQQHGHAQEDRRHRDDHLQRFRSPTSPAGTLLVQTGTFNPTNTFTNSGTADVRIGAVLLSNGTFTNFASSTLTGGTYLVAGTFRFNSANIVNNAATIVLDGAASAITDNAGTPANALANFAHNATGASFKIINGRNLFSSDLARAGHGQRRAPRRHRDDLRERHERPRHRRPGRLARHADRQRQLHAERDRNAEGRDRQRVELRQARRHRHRASRR